MHSLDLSAVLTVIGIIILFSGAIAVTLIAPTYVDPAWTMPSSNYQVQMYEESDPHFYISSAGTGGQELQFVHHLRAGKSLLAFQETKTFHIQAPKDLEAYVTKENDPVLKLTARLLFLKPLETGNYELYDPKLAEGFSAASSDGILEDWADENFTILDPEKNFPDRKGVIFVKNPVEFRIVPYEHEGRVLFRYSHAGDPVSSLEALTSPPLSFTSRKDLIHEGEHIYAIEGCWYCHTDQTRTLIQDLVMNGSDSYPAPPSSPNEYIYQEITFPGTKRNGPDLSRVAIKRPSRDWHKAHFWSPKTASRGSIMPAFRHFFDFDPRGTSPLKPGVPNHRFEAVFQYLMTKGSRITPPTEAWWLGKDPIQTLEIIEGRKKLP